MASAEIEQRLQQGLERIAQLDGRSARDLRQEAIRRYLARRGVELLDELSASSPGTSLTDEEAEAIASEETDANRRERGQ